MLTEEAVEAAYTAQREARAPTTRSGTGTALTAFLAAQDREALRGEVLELLRALAYRDRDEATPLTWGEIADIAVTALLDGVDQPPDSR
jgi:hypothetical protein